MASTCVVSIIVFTILEIVAAQKHQQQLKSISLGSSLSPTGQPSTWKSSSGRFEFGFYPQGTGFSVGIRLVDSPNNKTVVWTANRDDPPVSTNATLSLNTTGKLVLITEEGKDKLVVDVPKNASSASMLDSGEFVLYGKSSDNIIWSSFNSSTDTILGGQSLYDGQELLSSVSETNKSTGRFCLKMQEDGNLVSYPTNTLQGPGEAYWSSDTMGSRTQRSSLKLDPDGHLQVFNGTTKSIASAFYNNSAKSMNETVIYRATLDSDGILRLYSHHFEIAGDSNVIIEWYALQNTCEVKGFCGLNSFCYKSTQSRNEANCQCFPGFDFINPDMKFLGCYRNFSDEEGCKRKKPEGYYSMTNLEITKLGGLPYAQFSVNKKGCSKSCLDDCNCGAALYLDGNCRKFKLPLVFAMKDQSDGLLTLFVKWRSSKANLGTSITAPAPPKVVADSKRKLNTIVAACLGSITFLCFVLTIFSLLAYKLRVNRYQKLQGNSSLGPTQEFTLQSFSYNELEQATKGFQIELGRGCFGAVYKGDISEGNKMIAVKRLENPVEEGERKFQAEMAAVRKTHHKNLVRLLGFCMQSSKKLLVYEFMSKGSLENLLFNVKRGPLRRERLRIALDVARGLLYLQEECEVQIIHCNINPRNILLDDSSTAKISNFGLAKLLMPNQTGIVAGVTGTSGYIAPEWQNSGLITVKSDVYSFGVVLLEIVCCRSNFEVNVLTSDQVLLSAWVYNCFVAGDLNKLVGVKEEEEEEEEEEDMKTLERMVKVGLWCIQDEPNLRPSMKNVIFMLEGAMDIPVPPLPSSSHVIT